MGPSSHFQQKQYLNEPDDKDLIRRHFANIGACTDDDTSSSIPDKELEQKVDSEKMVSHAIAKTFVRKRKSRRKG